MGGGAWDYDRLMARVVEGRKAGVPAWEIADQLNEEGFRTPTAAAAPFTKNKVNQLLAKLGMSRRLMNAASLPQDEWWLPDLASELKISPKRASFSDVPPAMQGAFQGAPTCVSDPVG